MRLGSRIAIPLFDGFTALDAVGPYEVLARLPGAQVRFVAAEPGPKRTEIDMLSLVPDAALADLRDPEVLVVPGGRATRTLLEDEALLGWLRAAHELRVDDIGVHRLAAARRGGHPRRP